MNSVKRCPKCGGTSSSDQLDELCPRCLLATGVEGTFVDTSIDETLDSSRQLAIDQVVPLEKEFGDYEIIEEIARGGMGVVYRARHKGLNRLVALKMILKGQFASESDVRRFYLEAESAANLDHPGIVPIYEMGERGGHHFFSMKLIEGGTLTDHLPELRTDTRSVVKVIAKVARAVHHAHVRGILHRDLKPANILIDDEGNPLVSDLGLAKRIQSESDITGTGAIVGTPAYMPPEQAAADREITTAADIYSMGAVLYEALVGQPPHQETSAAKTLVKVIDGEVTAPRDIDNRVDRILELICMQCLQRDPSRRYASASALADDLENWLEGRRVSVRPPSMASVISDIFYGNLRSAIGAAVIGVVAGLLIGFWSYALSVGNSFGRGSEYDLVELYDQLPSMERHEIVLAAVPKYVYPLGIVGALIVYLFAGMTLQRLVRPKTIREAIALSLVAGMFMTVTDFASSMGTFFMGHDITTRQARDIKHLTEASLLEGQQREQALRPFFQRLPELHHYPPRKQSELLAKNLTVDNAFYMASLKWGTLLTTASICLFSCSAGGIHAFRLHSIEARLLSNAVCYLEPMLISIIFQAFLVVEVISVFGIESSSGETVPFSLRRVLGFAIVIVILVPGFRLWKWYWRWATYPIAIAMLWWILFRT